MVCYAINLATVSDDNGLEITQIINSLRELCI